MRMRKKKNLLPRLERMEGITVMEPAAMRGIWRELMPDASGLRLEIGCGKGRFISQLAGRDPGILHIALEREKGAIVMAMEKAAALGLENVFFVIGDAAALGDYFAQGEIDELYINFCDPWTKRHREKRRLTHRDFLALYRKIMCPGGHIFFKTDNTELFEFSRDEFREFRMDLIRVSTNLHTEDIPNIMTEYEERFSSQGIAINYIEAAFCD